jgi:hypothetical protein
VLLKILTQLHVITTVCLQFFPPNGDLQMWNTVQILVYLT